MNYISSNKNKIIISKYRYNKMEGIINKIYQWGSWKIKFEDGGIIDVYDYGKGTYCQQSPLIFQININNIEYKITFNTNEYNSFMSTDIFNKMDNGREIV
jgi:hypothetical protein